MNRLTHTLLAIGSFMIGVVIVTYMIDAVQTKQQVDSLNSKTDTMSREHALSEMMKGCDDGSYDGPNFDQTTYCSCVANQLLDVYGINETAKMALNLSQDEMTAKFQPYINDCLRQQGLEV